MEVYFVNPNHEHRVLGSGTYKDHKWTILSLGSHPTAYVENKTGITCRDEIISVIDAHGEINYIGGANWETDDEDTQYFGWDYGHFGDYLFFSKGNVLTGHKWTFVEILAEVYSVIDQLIETVESR